MTEPSKTDPVPAATKVEKDHALVFDMMNSVAMQKRLAEARTRRARVLAERAALAADAPEPAESSAVTPVDTPAPAAVEVADPVIPVTPAPPPELSVAQVESVEVAEVAAAALPTVLVSETTPRHAPPVPDSTGPKRPVLRAAKRRVGPEPGRMVLGSTSAPADLSRVQSKGMAAGLFLGVVMGVGMTWAIGVATRAPSGPSVLAATGGVPAAIMVEPTSSSSAAPDGGTFAADRLVLPRPRPAALSARNPSAGVTAVPSAPQGGGTHASVAPLAQSPQVRIDDVLRSTAASGAVVAQGQPSRPSARPPFTGQLIAPAVPPTDIGLPPAQAVPADPASSGPRTQVIARLLRGTSDAAMTDLRSTLRTAGSELVATRTARFEIAQSEVRYFHAQDRAQATRIARSIGTEARDFSAFRPSPPVGTVEVWLADRQRIGSEAAQ